MRILGKELAKQIKTDIKNEINELKINNPETNIVLVIMRVGNDPASIKYTNNKIKAAKEVGITPYLYELSETISQKDFDVIFEDTIKDNEINGVIVQLPLPKSLNLDKVNELYNVYPDKDVDGFGEINVGKLNESKTYNVKDFNVPCTAKGCIDLIQSIGYEIEGKTALVIGRSNIVGKPVARMLEQNNATVIQANSKTPKDKLNKLGALADIVVCAVGKLNCYEVSMFPNAKVIIDVGINVDERGRMFGDLFDDVDALNSEHIFITPVPGGVGPMTVCNLLYNTLESYKRNKK